MKDSHRFWNRVRSKEYYWIRINKKNPKTFFVSTQQDRTGQMQRGMIITVKFLDWSITQLRIRIRKICCRKTWFRTEARLLETLERKIREWSVAKLLLIKTVGIIISFLQKCRILLTANLNLKPSEDQERMSLGLLFQQDRRNSRFMTANLLVLSSNCKLSNKIGIKIKIRMTHWTLSKTSKTCSGKQQIRMVLDQPFPAMRFIISVRLKIWWWWMTTLTLYSVWTEEIPKEARWRYQLKS